MKPSTSAKPAAHLCAWLCQEKHRRQAKALRDEVEHAFTDHPRQTGESYLQHLWFTFTMTLRLLFTAVVLFLHGLLPFIFVRTASRQIETIYGIMRSRIPQARREELESNFEI